MLDDEGGVSRLRPARRALLRALPMLAVLNPWPTLASTPEPELRASRALLGTRVDVIAQGPSQALLLQAVESAFAEMSRLSALMSRYEADSETSRINQSAGNGQAWAVSAELFSVLRMGKDLQQRTGGLFDPTIGALKNWHFEAGNPGIVPPAAELAAQRRLIKASDLILDAQAQTARLARPGMALDLGGVAKLPILQAGMRKLQDWGVRNALINGGGDVFYLGSHQGAAWRLGLRDPRRPERLLGVLPVQGEGVLAASGDYERCFFAEGQKQHHILDPRSGRPARAAHGVSLWAPDVAAVNGLGPAFMLGGRDFAREWVQRHPSLQVLLVEPQQALWATPGLRAKLVLAA